jgi:excisionase family DNA binding protein
MRKEDLQLIKQAVRDAVREVLAKMPPQRKRRQKRISDFLTVSEVAKMLRVSNLTVYAYTKKGMPFIKTNRRLLFKKAEVLDWIAKIK